MQQSPWSNVDLMGGETAPCSDSAWGPVSALKGSQDRWGPIMSISRALPPPGVSSTQTKASRPSWDMPPYGTEVSQGTSTRAEIYYLKKSLTQEKRLGHIFQCSDRCSKIYILSKIVKEEIEKLSKYIIIKVIWQLEI